jgi:WD40 repeat protein
LDSCKCIRTLTGHNHPIYCLAVQGDYLYSTGGRRVRIWDLRTWTCVRLVSVKGAAGAFCGAGLSSSDLYLGGQV